MKKLLIFIIVFFLMLLVGILYYVILRTDIASQKVNKTVLSLAQGEYQYKPPMALVSYAAGDSVFLSNQLTLAESALNKGFEHIYMYGRQNIDQDFYYKNKLTLDEQRGAGYWLWKPYFILKTMEQLPDDSIIIYADSGVVFSAPPSDKLLKYLDEYDMILPSNGSPVPLRKHLKKEAQIILGIDQDEKILNSDEIWAYFMVIRNNHSTRKFIKEWLLLCQNAKLLTDLPFDPAIQEKEMETHLHDQSLLSVLVAQHPQKKIIIKRYEFRKNLGVDNFHRHPEGKYTSPKFHAAGLKKQIADMLFNNWALRQIRKYITEND